MRQIQLNLNYSKKGLLTPTDILSIVLFATTLAIAYFSYTYLFGGENYNDSSVHLYAYELSQSFYLSEVDESKHNIIKSQCKELLATNIEEYYFIRKHCQNTQRGSSQFSIAFTTGLIDSMRDEYKETNEFRKYMSTIRSEKPNCREFFQIDLSGNQDVDSRVMARNILVGNAIFKTPTQYYSACSDFTPRRS